VLLPRFPPLQSGAAFSSPAFSVAPYTTQSVWVQRLQRNRERIDLFFTFNGTNNAVKTHYSKSLSWRFLQCGRIPSLYQSTRVSPCEALYLRFMLWNLTSLQERLHITGSLCLAKLILLIKPPDVCWKAFMFCSRPFWHLYSNFPHGRAIAH